MYTACVIKAKKSFCLYWGTFPLKAWEKKKAGPFESCDYLVMLCRAYAVSEIKNLINPASAKSSDTLVNWINTCLGDHMNNMA